MKLDECVTVGLDDCTPLDLLNQSKNPETCCPVCNRNIDAAGQRSGTTCTKAEVIACEKKTPECLDGEPRTKPKAGSKEEKACCMSCVRPQAKCSAEDVALCKKTAKTCKGTDRPALVQQECCHGCTPPRRCAVTPHGSCVGGPQCDSGPLCVAESLCIGHPDKIAAKCVTLWIRQFYTLMLKGAGTAALDLVELYVDSPKDLGDIMLSLIQEKVDRYCDNVDHYTDCMNYQEDFKYTTLDADTTVEACADEPLNVYCKDVKLVFLIPNDPHVVKIDVLKKEQGLFAKFFTQQSSIASTIDLVDAALAEQGGTEYLGAPDAAGVPECAPCSAGAVLPQFFIAFIALALGLMLNH